MTTTELETFFGTPNKAADFFGVSPEAFINGENARVV